MDLLTNDLQRALLYVLILNDNGAFPTKANLNEFVQTGMPQASTSGTKFSMLLSRMALGDMMSPHWQPGDPVADYMISMGWLTEGQANGKLLLTVMGRALCVGLQGQTPGENDDATIYSATPEEPVAMSKLMGLLNRSNSQMYIDPYLEADHVQMLATKTPVRNVVTGTTYANDIATRLAEVSFPENFQVRVFKGDGLHDRGAVHADGGVAIVGTSLNHIRGKYVAMVDLPARISGDYRAILEEIWANSEPLEPYYPESKSKKQNK